MEEASTTSVATDRSLQGHAGCNWLFSPAKLTLGFILPLEGYPNTPAPTMRDLKGSTMSQRAGEIAIVTGAASGFGAGIAQSYIKAGAKVVIADLNQPMLDVDEKTFDRIYAVNLKSLHHVAQAVVPLMRQRKSGVIPERRLGGRHSATARPDLVDRGRVV